MTDALVEAVARAIADPQGGSVVWAHSTDAQKEYSRKQATATLQAIEAAGYRVVPVEATSKASECFECGCDTSGWLEAHKEGCTQTPL